MRRIILGIGALCLVLFLAARIYRRGAHDRRRRVRREVVDDPSMPKFLMLIGIPGSGKSTWAREFVFRCDASYTIVSSDTIRKTLTGDVNNQTKNSLVWDVVLNNCSGLLAQGRNVILDATNTNTDQRRSFVKQLPPCVRFVKTFPINKAIAKNRVARDVERGVDRARVPDSVVDVMARQFADSVSSLKTEGWRVH